MREKFGLLERLFWSGPSVLLVAERCGTAGDSASSRREAVDDSVAKKSRSAALEGAEVTILPNRSFALPKLFLKPAEQNAALASL